MRASRSGNILKHVDWQTIGIFLVLILFGWLNIYGASYNFDQTSIFDFDNRAGKQFDLAIYSGLYATFYYMKACYPHLKKTKGTVINFASGAGLFGNFGQSSYAAAKEGIRGLSRVAATEWAPDGVRVNVICPLAMTEGLQKFKEEYPERYAQTIKGVPMGRFADPEKDVGGLCVYLCSDEASFITGETITLQGGSGLRP